MSQCNQPPVGVPPPQGYPPEGKPPQGYPPQGYPRKSHHILNGPQYPPPQQNQKLQSRTANCLEGCIAALCCCWLFECCAEMVT